MSNKEKTEYRRRTLELIEELERLFGGLKPVLLEFSLASKDPEEIWMDPYGDEPAEFEMWIGKWNFENAEQYARQYKETTQQLSGMINSVKGAQSYPKGLFRELLEFSDSFEKVEITPEVKWKRVKYYPVTHELRLTVTPESMLKSSIGTSCDEYREQGLQLVEKIKRGILIYENERDESEPSFLG